VVEQDSRRAVDFGNIACGVVCSAQQGIRHRGRSVRRRLAGRQGHRGRHSNKTARSGNEDIAWLASCPARALSSPSCPKSFAAKPASRSRFRPRRERNLLDAADFARVEFRERKALAPEVLQRRADEVEFPVVDD
jgi:hypothetical protein